MSVFIPIPQKGNAKECSNYCTITVISNANKVVVKILQVRLQQCVNREIPDVHAGFRKGRGTTDQIANICWIIEKAREFWKNIYFCFIDYAKAFDCVDHNKLENSSRDGNTRPTYLPPEKSECCQEATVRTRYEIMDQFQCGKGVCQGCIFVPCLFNLYAEYIMQGARLDEAQSGIKITERNINNLRCADDNTLMAESKEEQKSLLMKVKEGSEKAG